MDRVLRSSRPLAIAATTALALSLAACTVPTPRPTATASVSLTADPLDGLSIEERGGQLFMVGTTATAAQSVTLDAITTRNVGGVFLSGRSRAGVEATASVVASLRSAASSSDQRSPLVVATDQEGGEVKVLSGPRFEAIPSALAQPTTDPLLRIDGFGPGSAPVGWESEGEGA